MYELAITDSKALSKEYMCGRFSFSTAAEISGKLGILPPDIAPNYNVAPMQHTPVLLHSDAQWQWKIMRWGLLPTFASHEKEGAKYINARAETLAEKPAYRSLVAHQRCLVPADGFYEFVSKGKAKQPMRFVCPQQPTFCFAGLYNIWHSPHSTHADFATFTIITTTPNDCVAPIHDRMPVILTEAAAKAWLNPDLCTYSSLSPLLLPYPSEDMQVFAVNPIVNSVKNNSPDCILPYTPPASQTWTLF